MKRVAILACVIGLAGFSLVALGTSRTPYALLDGGGSYKRNQDRENLRWRYELAREREEFNERMQVVYDFVKTLLEINDIHYPLSDLPAIRLPDRVRVRRERNYCGGPTLFADRDDWERSWLP